MPEFRFLPVPRIQVALYAVLCATGLSALVLACNLLFRGHAGIEPEMYLGMAVSWICSLLAEAWIAFVALSQIQRHLRYGAATRPWLVIVGFGVSVVVVRYLWFMLHGFLITRFLQDVLEYFTSSLFSLLDVSLIQGFEILSTLLCALLAVKIGGRRESAEADVAAGSLATGAVQALTLCCGLYLGVSVFANVGTLHFSRYGMDSMLTMQIVTYLVPLCFALVLGCGVYACWPHRLKQASGWGLYLWGALLGCLGGLPAGVFAALGALLFGVYTEWLGYVIWPVYAVSIVLLAAIVGLCFRSRSVEQPE